MIPDTGELGFRARSTATSSFFFFFFVALVPGSARREELLHAVYVHVDAGRGRLPAAPARQHLAREDLADLDHRGGLLDAPTRLHRAVRVGQAEQWTGEPTVSPPPFTHDSGTRLTAQSDGFNSLCDIRSHSLHGLRQLC